jgi:hypothetical protein
MKKFLKSLLLVWALLPALFWSGCYMYEYEIEKEAHNWQFVGLVNDSIAIVKVTLEQWGTEHDNHLMGYDDDFHKTVESHYYWVQMNSYDISKHDGSIQKLPELDSTDQYSRQIEKIVEYSTACAIILQDNKKKNLDTLEIDNCPKENSEKSPKFVGNYVKIDNCFYKIEKGKFLSQKPTYKFKHENYNIKFVKANGDYIIYGGKP